MVPVASGPARDNVAGPEPGERPPYDAMISHSGCHSDHDHDTTRRRSQLGPKPLETDNALAGSMCRFLGCRYKQWSQSALSRCKILATFFKFIVLCLIYFF